MSVFVSLLLTNNPCACVAMNGHCWVLSKACNYWSKCAPKWQFGGFKSAVEVSSTCLERRKEKYFNGNGN